ncbi:hypothetical protein D3C74_218410 [compost metagenome]
MNNERIQEINDLRNAVEFWKQAAETQKNNNLAILKEHWVMEEALEWYANKDNYDPIHLSKNGWIPIDKDNGKRARTALSHLKGE